MKTLKEQLKTIMDHAIRIHEKTASWTAKLIGPTVFNYGTKDKNWNLRTAELLKFPDGSLGKELGEFLQKYHVEPLAGAEYHDLHHVLFDFSISFKDEVALQFFLQGNGKRSIASISTCIGAWFILPTQWKYLKASYERGKKCKDISILNSRTLLHQNFTQVRASLFH